MLATLADLFALLDSLGIAHETVEHPPFFTVEEGHAWHDRIPGLACKNLFLKDKAGRFWLVIMPAEKRADLGALGKALNTRFSFGKPEALLELLALTPGSVCPFGLMNDSQKQMQVVLDAGMMAADKVNFHPLHNAASTAITPADLQKFLGHLGYQPVVMECGAG